MTRRSIPTALALSLALASLVPLRAGDDDPTKAKDSTPDAVRGITARELGGHMKFLASDLMRGRDTASPEIRLAAEYLATRLSAAGAEPAGAVEDGQKTYFQRFPLEVVTPLLEGTSLDLVVERNGSKKVIPCKVGVDVVVSPSGLAPGEVEAPVVFVGYGTADDYAGLEVKGRLVLVLAGQPPKKEDKEEAKKEAAKPEAKEAAKPEAKKEATRGVITFGRMNAFGSNAKRDEASKRGALGVLIAQPHGGAGLAPGTMPRVGGFGRPRMTLGSSPTSIPALNLTDPIRDQVLPEADAARPHPIEGLRARFVFAAKKESKEDRNVIGIFPGSDPARAKEVVVFSAHYDHVGVDDKGVIFNGSDDNSSGTSGLLEIAEAFGDGPRPARTVAFLWVSGEEKGLFGSDWFSNHVCLPEGSKIVADLNLDMISRNAAREIGITPSDKHPDYSTLIPMAKSACQAEGLAVKFNADEYYARTDSYNFARKGIPVIFFFCGVHEDYHRSTDDVAKADFDKAARVARAAYRLGWQVADAPESPKKIKAEPLKAASR